ncbi:MAG: TerC/Alx family metal homeostasis membrane protein [Ignavibacterium album]|uniref:TerC/Alx family metal homeostasis membrane protein n=1 Tax=Ignavibacterium album TaxID=591197 RepID=UPI0026EF4D46|nr:TerC/Alx family metal homeostasis membrane protein [Ignavibacterium album]MCX8104547.1 TerC/Alx family metal homeostasis membrane protein [Ignavibacterium album]
MLSENIFWIIFSIVITLMLMIDLYVTDHRRGKITLKASLIWSGIWIITALLFNVFLYFYLEDGHQKAIEFLTGYIIEKSLSVDNLFVFLMIFSVMNVKAEHQPHILKWGILGAIFFRIIFILAGVALINIFHPIIYVFGALLIYAAYKMAFGSDEKIDVENNWLIKIFVKYFKLKTDYDGRKFFIKESGKTYITTMFLTLLLIESSDIVFAIDSIPAIIAITRDTFIIISSNIFAILGLRALYFALAGLVDLFKYLKYGVALLLFYVGIKMLISDFYKIPTEISLIIIITILTASILLSLIKKKRFSE